MVNDSEHRKMNDGNDIRLKDIIAKTKALADYLFSRWKVLFSVAIIGALVGFVYAYNKEPVYTATTTFVLESGDGGNSLAQYAGIASMVGVNLGGGGGGIFHGDNILELYKSSTMIKRTLLTEIAYNGKKMLLVDRYVDFNDLRESWSEDPRLSDFKFNSSNKELSPTIARVQDSILSNIIAKVNKEYLTVSKPDKSLSIIQVEVKSKDEFFAKYFNDLIVKNVNDFYIQTKSKRSLENVSILQQKTDSVRAVMNGDIYAAAAISDATPNLNPTRQVQRVAPAQRSQFSAETNKAILGELLKNLELSKIALRKEVPLIQVVDQPYFPLPAVALGRVKGAILGAFLFSLVSIGALSFRFIIKDLLE